MAHALTMYWREGGWGKWPILSFRLATNWIVTERAVYFARERVDDEALLGVVAPRAGAARRPPAAPPVPLTSAAPKPRLTARPARASSGDAVLHTPTHPLARRAALLAVAALLSLLVAAPARASPPDALAPPRPAVMATIRRIESTLRTSRYDHATRVDVRAGRYDFDCSGMAAWVLARGAPQAHAATVRRAGGRALARDYYRQIVATRPGRPAQGWGRVARVADALPGDVVAWLTARGRRSPNTGHVLFVVETPRPVPGAPGAFAVRVADASAYQHADDTRAAAGRDGFGMGTMLLFADPATGAVRGYGWRAGLPMWGRDAEIAIGRPLR